MDATNDDKLNFDDISFDDMVGEGLQATTEEVSEEPVAEKPVEESVPEAPTSEAVTAESELDTDATNIKEEEEEEREEEVQEEDSGDEPVDSEETEDLTVVTEVLTKLGYKPEELGKDYEDSTEGLVQMTKDIGTQVAKDQLDALMEQFPSVKNHLEYVLSGGTSENFMQAHDPRQDYGKINVNEKDIHTQKMLVGNYFKMKGHDDTFIKEMLEDYEDGGKLHGKAQLAQKALTNAQREQRNVMMQDQRKQQQEQQKQQQEFWKGVHGTIQDSREFAGITVPEREKNKFFDYLARPVNKDGMTKRDVDHMNASLDTKLAIDYLMYKGFKLNEIIKSKMGTTKAKDLKSRLTKYTETVKNAKRPRRRNTGFDIEDLDLSVI